MRRWILNRWVLAGLGLTVLLGAVFAWRVYAWSSRWSVHVDWSAVPDAEVYWDGARISMDGWTTATNMLGVPEPLSLLLRSVEYPAQFDEFANIDLVVVRGIQGWAFDIPWARGLTSLRIVEGADRGIAVVDQDGNVWPGSPKAR
jgi:hypothetical protein